MGSVKLSGSLSALILIMGIAGVTDSFAGPREQARRIHDRLTGVPPSAALLNSMEAMVAGGNAVGAAREAMNNPAFVDTTLRDFATPWFNRDGNVRAPLTDSVATVVGMIRDDVPFDQVLYGDIIYTPNPDQYSQTDNDQYADLTDLSTLVQSQQSVLPGAVLTADQTAGVMTTRGFSEAYLIAGTNRAATRFTMVNFMCNDMEDVRDVTREASWVRQDVDRLPGGNSAIFLNDCIGCHSGLDPLTGGFAYYTFDEDLGQTVYTAGEIQPKFVNDAQVFPAGYVTVSDRWTNVWRGGPNSALGWSAALTGSGNGAKSTGMELAGSRAFAECQVQKAFAKVCHRDPSGPADMGQVRRIADIFQGVNYSMRTVFAEVAAVCMGN
ncbi:MAG: hypothetical protein ACR2RB_06730 [Gammaproteobacteria bacterium]